MRSSSSAPVSVSATKIPPYGPKWPRASGRSYIRIADLGYESRHFTGVLDALCRFHATGDIHAPGLHRPEGEGDVLLREAAGEDQGPREPARDERPVEALAAPAVFG